MYQISEIVIYPVKGLAGIQLQSSRVFEHGLEYDRNWMLIDSENHFISQRQNPLLALFVTQIDEENLIITYNNSKLVVPLSAASDEKLTITVWDDKASVTPVSDEADQWFSEQLGNRVRLVKLASTTARQHTASTTSQTFDVSLADAYPFLILGWESLFYLNKKMETPMSMNRFRPNIVINTSLAHEEDDWQEFTIGNEVRLCNIKPCGRCQVVTIDQSTAEVDSTPLKVLNTYRKQGNNVNFGMNAICKQVGSISVGDQIHIHT